jgi:hypothetical protein
VRLYLKNNQSKMVEHLSHKWEALSSNTNIAKKEHFE